MKKFIKAISVMLMLCMMFSMTACSTDTGSTDTSNTQGTNNDTGATNADVAGIVGEYILDASSLGMPMKWYIKVNADATFNISTKRDFSDNKGEGTVGGKDGTYMFVYKENTVETPKTATFTLEGKNLLFSTNVPIGSASVSPNADEGKYPIAKLIAHEDIIGTYMGTFEKTAGMGTVAYNYELVLGYGLEYTFTSSFTMMGTSSTITETGNFDIAGEKITFAAKAVDVDGEAQTVPAAVEGTIKDGTIKAAFKLSKQASEAQEIEAKLAVYADVAGTYTGMYTKSGMGGMNLSYGVTLELDAFGGYKYATFDLNDSSNKAYEEKGSYTYENGKFKFTSDAEGATAVDATYANYVLTASFRINSMVSNAVSLTLYNEAVNGVFYALTEQDGKEYAAQMRISGNEFLLMVGIKGSDEPNYVAKGTIEIKAGMVTSIVFTTTEAYTDTSMTTPVTEIPPELKTVSGAVAESGINAELLFDLDDTQLIGFQFTHDLSVFN